MRRRRRKKEFSKILLIQESILIWILTICSINLAYQCITNQYLGELPWISAMIAFPWGAYGVSQAFYYKKAEKENTKNGLKYEATLSQLKQAKG